jgi:hypothetical protein
LIRCREIQTDDLASVVSLLTRGFKKRDRGYWRHALQRLTEHATPSGFPKYGYLLVHEEEPVGVLLLIFSSREVDGKTLIRCNGSSLYVAPEFSGYGALLIKRAESNKDVTYFNLTPGRHTWPMVEALGYKRFSNGTFISIPSLCCSMSTAYTEAASVETCRRHCLEPFETELLLAHADWGCVSLICRCGDSSYPYVFGIDRRYYLPLAHLVYCRDQKDFVRLAGSVGRTMLRRGIAFIALDANGPIQGLVGRYIANRPKYWMGPETPRLGDLPYTERVMFGY